MTKPKKKFPKAIDLKKYNKKSKQLGSNTGAFYEYTIGKKTTSYYIKYLEADISGSRSQFPSAFPDNKYTNRNRNRFNNEFLALKLYELYEVCVPEAEFISLESDGKNCYGISSKKEEGITSFRNLLTQNPELFTAACEKAQEDFLIDVLLSNYDVVGSAMDNLFYDKKNKKIVRIDPGGALRYRAQGAPKKAFFNEQVLEFEDMATGSNSNTKFHLAAIKNAGTVFNGIYDSPALLISLRKLVAISDEEIIACVNQYGFDTGESGNKGEKKDEELIEQLLERKKSLIVKAEDKIIARLRAIEVPNYRTDYLKAAGIAPKHVELINNAVLAAKSDEEIRVLIKAAIAPFAITNEDALFNEIVKEFLHPKAEKDTDTYYKKYTLNKEDPSPIQRVKHGGMHASRTALHTEVIISLLKKAGYKEAQKLRPEDLFLIKVAAMFHDTGRKNDSGNDYLEWEIDGAHKCREWLLKQGFSAQKVEQVFWAMIEKDHKEQQQSNIYALVLASADSLDWVRSHGSDFNVNRMPSLLQEYIPKKTLEELALVAKKVAVAQGDSPRTHMGVGGKFDIAIKKTYEQSSDGCYSAIKRSYLSFFAEFAKIQIPEIEIISFEEQFNALLSSLKSIITTLEAKSTEDAKSYKAVLDKAKALERTLTTKSDTFFNNPSPASFEFFKENCCKDIQEAQNEFKKHRGIWYQLDPVLRQIIGVIATLTVLPALIVAGASKHGYRQTFFSTPKTDSETQLNAVEMQFRNNRNEQ